MRRKNGKGKQILIPILALVVCGIVVLVERYGVSYYKSQSKEIQKTSLTESVTDKNSCLILTSQEEDGGIYEEMTEFVLESMKIGYDVSDISESSAELPLKEDYDTVVITFQGWDALGTRIDQLSEWVEQGGALLVAVTPLFDSAQEETQRMLGIRSLESGYPPVYGMQLLNDCMIGAGDGDIFWYDEEKKEGLTTSLDVELEDTCQVYMTSEDGEVPLIWTVDHGQGKIAVMNENVGEKYQRGFLCMSYTLLHDVVIYPVINASAYYLDDFPSPVPSGDGSRIREDYGVDIASFYFSIWWPEIMQWEKDYKIVHTGVIIEEYSDDVEAPFAANEETSRFTTFGNMLLNNGGELGFHGYNHMPLCAEGIDDDMQYGDYRLWKSKEDMTASVEELRRFSEELFPDNDFTVYVPPSNIISETGREALLEADPEIGIIAATYLKDADGRAYEQEFTVEENGIISTPRITSGCVVEPYQKLTALSELNFQFVQSHFMHPDDVLDPDRGGDLGWEYLSGEFESYLEWITSSAEDIRNVTGSEMGTAVEQYDELSMKRERTEDSLKVSLGGFSGAASFILRLNEGKAGLTEGCSIEHIKGDLYLVQAYEPEITIYLE